MTQRFHILYDDGEFWQWHEDYDSQIPAEFNVIDKLANGYKWSMSVQGKGQRKRHTRSIMTSSIWAMLESVKFELSRDAWANVYVLTPNVEVYFHS